MILFTRDLTTIRNDIMSLPQFMFDGTEYNIELLKMMVQCVFLHLN